MRALCSSVPSTINMRSETTISFSTRGEPLAPGNEHQAVDQSLHRVHTTVCPRSLDPFYVLIYYINWVPVQTVCTVSLMVFILDGNSRNSCARKEQTLLFDLLKAFDETECSHKSDFFLRKGFFCFEIVLPIIYSFIKEV